MVPRLEVSLLGLAVRRPEGLLPCHVFRFTADSYVPVAAVMPLCAQSIALLAYRDVCVRIEQSICVQQWNMCFDVVIHTRVITQLERSTGDAVND